MSGGFTINHKTAFAHEFAGFGFFGDLVGVDVKYISDGVAHFPGFGIDGDGLGTFINGCLWSSLTVFDEEERRTGSFGVED